MIIPIRCFSCGKVVANKWEEYKSRVNKGENIGDLLDDLGFRRFCCRRMLITHVCLIDTILAGKYK